MQMKDLKPGQHFMVATEGMRGHFACEMWMNDKDIPDTVFPEPWQSDSISFGTREGAVEWAKQLADISDLPYVE